MTLNAFFAVGGARLVSRDTYSPGENWHRKDGWLSSAGPCWSVGWYGVGCTDGLVDAIVLPSNNLDGALPKSIRTLTTLRVLDFSSNRLQGTYQCVHFACCRKRR